VPIIAIALTFDSINSEFNRRTMSRVLSQPIYRDALLLGKFLAGLFTLTLVLTAIWLLIFGLGIIFLGVAPGGEEVGRILWFLVATIVYGDFWLALALTFSIVFRQPATAGFTSLSVWLFFIMFWSILANLLAVRITPVRYGFPQEMLAQAQTALTLTRLSPNTLYIETMIPLLQPTIRSLGIVLPMQLEGAVMGAPLPLTQSVLLIWPSLTWMVAYTLLLFTLGYVLFQRQEIRA